VALNRAVAVAVADGWPRAPEPTGERSGDLAGYHLLAAIRADLLRRLGRHPEAADAYRMASEVAPTDAKRLYLTRLADTAATG
jgi:RNA polymerase sigma-70 factor, ECF subfamily